jgi:hypothetical protein
MKNKLILVFFIFSLIGFAVGYYLLKIYDCEYSVFCYNLATRAFALYYGMPALALVFSMLLFIPRALDAWKKFAIWFVPLAALLFIFYPEPGSGDLFSPYPEQIFQWVSALYVVVSVVIIAIVSLRTSEPLTNR